VQAVGADPYKVALKLLLIMQHVHYNIDLNTVFNCLAFPDARDNCLGVEMQFIFVSPNIDL